MKRILGLLLVLILNNPIIHSKQFSLTNTSLASTIIVSGKWEIYDGDEQSIKKYLDSAESLDPIEGIYSVSDKTYNHYGVLTSTKDNWVKLAIIKDLKKPERGLIQIAIESDKKYPKFAITGEFSKLNDYNYSSKQYYLYEKPDNVSFELNPITKTLSCVMSSLLRNTKRSYIKISSSNTGVDDEGNKWSSSGSCFAISTDGYFATNFHVVKKAKKLDITLFQGSEKKTYSAKTILKDVSNDIAIIKIEDSTFKAFDSIPYSLGDVKNVGEKVFTIGYPKFNVMGSNIKYSEGNISAMTGLKDDIRYYQISVPVTHGNSGGPLFTYNGLIVGITSTIYRGDQTENVAYAIKSFYLNGLIRMMSSKEPEVVTNKTNGKEYKEGDVVNLYQKYIGLIKVINEDK
jgi:S1-C subfamily serine protease